MTLIVVSEDRMGTLVLRIWLEKGSPDPLRVRIRSGVADSNADWIVTAHSSVASVLSCVATFIEDFVDGAG